MKLVIQALIGSVVIHLIYFICTVGFGYFKTKYYEPDIADTWNNVDILQSEVAFGQAISPLFYVLSLVGIAGICGIILFLYNKLVK